MTLSRSFFILSFLVCSEDLRVGDEHEPEDEAHDPPVGAVWLYAAVDVAGVAPLFVEDPHANHDHHATDYSYC
jgi:hypothetical protein